MTSTKVIKNYKWSSEIENAYRFYIAGYKDEKDYYVCMYK